MSAHLDRSFLRLCAAMQTRMGADQFFSHATAARIHRMWVPPQFSDSELHVSTLKPGRAPRVSQVQGHQVTMGPGWDVRVVRGLHVIDPVSAWMQLAPQLSGRELVIVGDSLVRRHYPITTVANLQRRVQASHGRRGTGKLRAALERVRADTDSPRETELRLEIVDAGFPEPEVNRQIHDADGRFIGFGDLVYFEYKVLVEYEGDQHRTNSVQFGRDLTRQQELGDADWIHVRISKYHWPNRRAYLLDHLSPALRERGWRGGGTQAA